MYKFNAMIKGIGVREVEGTFTKLKGYSKLKLYSHKVGKTWYIREFYTGRQLGAGNTEALAKIDSRNYLKDYTQEQLKTQIDLVDSINEDT